MTSPYRPVWRWWLFCLFLWLYQRLDWDWLRRVWAWCIMGDWLTGGNESVGDGVAPW